MKRFPLFLFVCAIALIGVAGCSHLDLAASGDPNRVLKGTVTAGRMLPAGTEVVVRLVATESVAATHLPSSDLVTRAVAPSGGVEHLLGEHRQILPIGTNEPVPFQIEYLADDALLRRGVNVDARISIDGQVRYRTVNAHVVTLASSPYRQEVEVQQVQ